MITLKDRYFKIIGSVLLLYILAMNGVNFYLQYQATIKMEEKIKKLQLELENSIKRNIVLVEEIKKKVNQITLIEKSYDTQENVEIKLKRIFKRLSLRDTITLQSINKICIDHYIIVARVDSNNQDIIENFRKILSHLGKVKQSDTNKNILYIDYIMEKNNG